MKTIDCFLKVFNFFSHLRTFFTGFLGGEKGRERSISWLPPICAQTEGTHNPGVYPDWESNLQPFGYGMTLQPTEPHQPGPIDCFSNHTKKRRKEKERERGREKKRKRKDKITNQSPRLCLGIW